MTLPVTPGKADAINTPAVEGGVSSTPSAASGQAPTAVVAPTRLTVLSSYADLIAKVIGLLTWPVIALIAVAIFHRPIYRMAELLPDKFEKSEEFGIGILSIKIREQAKATGNEELAKIISGLSQESIQWLMKIGDGSHRLIATDDGRDGITRSFRLPRDTNSAWKNLEQKGLLKANVPLNDFEAYFFSLKPQNDLIPMASVSAADEAKLLRNSVQLTESGKRAYRIIISVVSEMIAVGPSAQSEKKASK